MLAEREFVGEDWFNWLMKNDIPFDIRLRKHLVAHDAKGHDRPPGYRFERRGSGKPVRLTFFKSGESDGMTLTVSARHLPTTSRSAAELRILATNRPQINAFAAAWASRTAAIITGTKSLPRKNHGHHARSFFPTGFDHIRNRMRSHTPDAFAAWQNLPKPGRVV